MIFVRWVISNGRGGLLYKGCVESGKSVRMVR